MTMVPCPSCSLMLPVPPRGREHREFCPSCRRDVRLVAWPALDRAADRALPPPVAGAGETSCFRCADRVASGVCAACGCFTCAACEAEWFGERLCLSCLHAQREVDGGGAFRRRAFIFDNIALMLMVMPMVLIPLYGVPLAMLCAPVSLFLVIRHWRSFRGLPPRGPARLILSGGLAVGLLLLAAAGVVALVVAAMDLPGRAARAGNGGRSGGPVTTPVEFPEWGVPR